MEDPEYVVSVKFKVKLVSTRLGLESGFLAATLRDLLIAASTSIEWKSRRVPMAELVRVSPADETWASGPQRTHHFELEVLLKADQGLKKAYAFDRWSQAVAASFLQSIHDAKLVVDAAGVAVWATIKHERLFRVRL